MCAMKQKRTTYEEVETPEHAAITSFPASPDAECHTAQRNADQQVQQSRTSPINLSNSPASVSELKRIVSSGTRHSVVFGLPMNPSSHGVFVKEEELEIELPELVLSTRISQLSDLSQPSDASNLEEALESRHRIGAFEGVSKQVLADSLRRELELDTLAIKKDKGFVFCSKCGKKVFSPKGLKEWRVHCQTQHGRSKESQYRIVSEARFAAQSAAAVANKFDNGTPPAPGSRFAIGRFEGATRAIQKEATRLEIDSDPLAKRIPNDGGALACQGCRKRIATSHGLRDWRNHCRQVHMRTTKHQTSIIEKTREDAQKAALDLDVGYDKSRSSSSDSSLTDLDEDEDATSATGDLDGPPAVGSRFTVGHFRGVTNTVKTAAARLECEFDPLVESFDDASITCGECKRIIKTPVKQWRMHCRAVHQRSTRKQTELVERARATALREAELLRGSDISIRPSIKIQSGARVIAEHRGSSADSESLPLLGLRFTIGNFTGATSAVRKHACHLECEFDPLIESFDDDSMMCADCKQTIRGSVREWRQHCRTAHRRTTKAQTELVLRARAAALQSANIDPGSSEDVPIATNLDLKGQLDFQYEPVEDDTRLVIPVVGAVWDLSPTARRLEFMQDSLAEPQHHGSHHTSASSDDTIQMEDLATRDSSPLTQLSTSNEDASADAYQNESEVGISGEDEATRRVHGKRAPKRRAQYDSDKDLSLPVLKRARLASPLDSIC